MKPFALLTRSSRAARSRRSAVRLAALALATSALAACQTPAALDGQPIVSSTSGSGSTVRSPASERVIGGIVEMVLTHQIYPSFEAARENRIESVEDGSPLFAYIRATRPLGELAHPADPGGQFSFSEFPHLQIQIGDNESLRIISTCYVTMTGEEARRRELVVPLAPLTFRPGQVPADCWLEATASGRSGPRTYEVRLAGFPGKFERWLPVPDLVALAPIATDFRNGGGEYATMLRATPLRSATVVASAATAAAGSALVAIDGGASPSALSSVPSAASGSASTPVASGGSGASGGGAAGSSLVPVGGSDASSSVAASVSNGRSSTLVPARPSRSATAIESSPITTVTAGANGSPMPTLASIAPNPVASTNRPSTLVAAASQLPGARQEIGSGRMELQLRTLSAAILGRQPSDSYFVERQWTGVNDSRGRVQLQQVEAAAVFRGETCSWQRLLVTRRPNAQTLTDVAQAGEPVVVNCADLP